MGVGEGEMEVLMDTLGTGTWNILHYIMVAYGSSIPVSHAFASAFFSPRVDHTCRPPPYTAYTHNTSHPADSSCSYLRDVNGTLEEMQCEQWDFDNSTFSSTVTEEFELVCGREYLQAIYQSIYMVGVFAGAPIIGPLADRFGRKPLVIAGSLLFSTVAIGSVWLGSFSTILMGRFLVGLGHTSLLKTAYIMALEMSTRKVRGIVGPVAVVGWGYGSIILGGVAYLLRDWRHLQLAMSLQGLIHLLGFTFIDESPRWLAVQGRHDEALAVLKRAARWNKVTLPPDERVLSILKAEEKEAAANDTGDVTVCGSIKETMKGVFILFRTPRLRFITIISYIAHFVVAKVYFGISLSGGNLGTNPFMYMSLNGVVEVVSLFYNPTLLNKLGRRFATILYFMVVAVVSLALPFIPLYLQWLKVTLAIIGKMTIASAFAGLTLLFSELFPTEVRSRGMSTSFMISRVGAMIVPFINDMLGSVYPWVPAIVYGAVSAMVGVMLLSVKETLGQTLPETVKQLEETPRVRSEPESQVTAQESDTRF